MDFQTLSRKDLQFFCKKNKIPANMTNIAMVDALKALEIVEGIDEFMNQSPTSVAKNLPSGARTAARTTRRKTKDETQPSELLTRSCFVTTKSLTGELEQENRNTNVLPQSSRRAAVTMNLEATDMKPEPNASKTPAVRSTRRAQTAASSKKDESVQRVYSTRRSVKLLEESMADLSLKTKESLTVPSKKNDDAETGTKSDDNSEKTEEAEVISVRDLNDSLEKEWDGSENDPDLDILYGDLGGITFFDATSKEQMNGTESNTVPASDSFAPVEEQEPLQEDGFVVVDHAASTTTNIVKESESEEMKNDSESESEDDDSGVVVDTKQEAFGSEVSASDNVSKADSVPTVLQGEELKELESSSDSEESCESDQLMDSKAEVAVDSDKKTLAVKEVESDSDEWSDYEINEMEVNSCGAEEMIEASSSTLAGKETKTPLKDKKKKTIDEESLKDISMRQLTKMVKELAIKKSNKTSA